MKKKLMNYNGIEFRREVTLIGDVEKITWFNNQTSGYSEIHDQVVLNHLEQAYEDILLAEITPPLPII